MSLLSSVPLAASSMAYGNQNFYLLADLMPKMVLLRATVAAAHHPARPPSLFTVLSNALALLQSRCTGERAGIC